MKTGNESPASSASTDDTSSSSSSSPTTRTFTPTERQSELDALRQRGLTTQLNRHFNEQVAKETAAIQSALDQLKKRQQLKSTTTTTVSANREISPLDAVYLSITKWRRESRQKKRETLLLNQRYASQTVDAKATTNAPVDLPQLEIPVSDAAQQIESVLQDYLKTGALEMPSVESLGKDNTFAQAHHQEQYSTMLQELAVGTVEADAQCTPTAKNISVYVRPGAFRDGLRKEDAGSDRIILLDDTENNREELENTSSREADTPEDATRLHLATTTETSANVLPQSDHDGCSADSTTAPKRMTKEDDAWDEPPPGLIASPRSTDVTFPHKTKSTQTSSNRFTCGVVVVVAVGMYYYWNIP